jgi:hypothetical protein
MFGANNKFPNYVRLFTQPNAKITNVTNGTIGRSMMAIFKALYARGAELLFARNLPSSAAPIIRQS